MATPAEKVLAWFERSRATYWKLYAAGSKDKIAQFWPKKEDESAGGETPQDGMDALAAELEELEPGRYLVQACPSTSPKDTASYFRLPFTIGRSTGGGNEGNGNAGRGIAFAETGIFGHPDVQAHIQMVKEQAQRDMQIALLNQKIDALTKQPPEAAPSPMEAAMAKFIGSMAPYAPALVQALNGGTAVAPVAAQPVAPVAGAEAANEEADAVESALTRIKAADGDYWRKLKTLADFAEKNPEGFRGIMANVEMLA